MPLPALRSVDAYPIQGEGKTYVCLSDPSGVATEQVVLNPLAYYVATMLTGIAGADDIAAECTRTYSSIRISPVEIGDLVQQLDAKGFLQTARFDARRTRFLADFRRATTRAAHFAGLSYPADPAELANFLDGQFTRDGGPGPLPPRPGGGEPLRGLVVPHIDYHRGGHTYAHGYRRMYQHGVPGTVFVFGVAHNAQPVPFILTRKHFETPLGLVETDAAIMDRLEASCGWDPYEHEWVQRTEHSIEFHAIMLAHLYGPKVKIVPILCSMFSADPTMNDPSREPGVVRFLDACRDTVANGSGGFSVIASADMAHVGKRFGDRFDIDEAAIARIAARDNEDLVQVETMSPGPFYASVMKDLNRRRVCGINCIYATLRTLEGTARRGERLHYDYAHDPAGGIVSFASAALV